MRLVQQHHHLNLCYQILKHIQKMYQCGPYGPNHATAGTFAFRKELLGITKYNENASLAEEKEFLHNYTIPFVQLDPLKTILVFSHEHNTFDKRRMLENPNPKFTKESDKTIEMFIKYTSEANIKKYFLHDIDAALENYQPGSPEMKPDVLKQMKEIDEERKKMMQQMQEKRQQEFKVQIRLNPRIFALENSSFAKEAETISKYTAQSTVTRSVVFIRKRRHIFR